MILALKIALRVIQRRIDAGEQLDMVMSDYPKMSEEEQEYIKQEVLQSNANTEGEWNG